MAVVPIVTGISPHVGPLAGGNTVVLIGSGFTGANSVTFEMCFADLCPGLGGSATYSVISDTSIVATAPPISDPNLAIFPKNVIVHTASGYSLATAANEYTYVSTPSRVALEAPTLTPTAQVLAIGLIFVVAYISMRLSTKQARAVKWSGDQR